MEGYISKIERFSLHNGPGIRTTVFIQGCPLKCAWCGNPELHESCSELLYNPDICLKECIECLGMCPAKAIEKENSGKIIIKRDVCDKCRKCVVACPTKAISFMGMRVTVEDVLNELAKDIPFYESSGGGVTVSGGEPLGQPEFVLELLRACKKQNIHTALDTCGYAHWRDLKEILEYTDLVLYDLKFVDTKKHKRYTGVNNDLILKNLKNIAQYKSSSLIVRFPLVPGINDSNEDIDKLVDFLGSISFKRFDILPYHRLGVAKYAMLGKPFRLQKTKQPSREEIDSVRSLVMAKGVEVRVEV